MTLTSPQQRAVDDPSPEILCVAGAGSGKTRTLVARIQRLVAEGADPARIVAITFTNAAAAEMQKRLGDVRLAYIGTLHGFALRLIKESGKAIGYGKQITVITKEQSESLLDRAAAECRFNGTDNLIVEAMKQGPFKIEAKAKARHLEKAEVVALQYFRTLKAGQMLDFDSILTAAQELLAVHEQQPAPLPTHLFVDEFQDSSDADCDIYELLDVPNKFFVGDSDQAIYGFRGGNVANILDHAKPGSGVAVHYLEKNFRCAESICEAAQYLIENNTKRAAKQTISATGQAGTVTVAQCKDAHCERQRIVIEVRTAISLGTAPSEIAVLTRTNRLANEFADILEASGVPVAKKKRQSRPEDWPRLASFVSLLANPDNDALALYHIGELFGADKRQEAQMKAGEAMQTVNESTLNLPYGAAPGEVAELASRAGVAGREALDKLDGIVSRLPNGAGLDDLTFAMSRDENHESEMGSGVTVTTAHSAKGREWTVVFLPSFEKGIFPTGRKDTDLEEERRLAYVAFTRAKEALHISHCEERVPAWGDRRPQPSEPSQFIKEAGL